jgi:hypothetical protein
MQSTVEKQFHGIGQGWARFLYGRSQGEIVLGETGLLSKG